MGPEANLRLSSQLEVPLSFFVKNFSPFPFLYRSVRSPCLCQVLLYLLFNMKRSEWKRPVLESLWRKTQSFLGASSFTRCSGVDVFFLFFFFFPDCAGCRILVPQTRIEPWPTAVKAWHPNHWKVKVAQSCPILCDPMDCSPLGSSVHGILQTRILEWVAILFSRGSSQPRDQTQGSCIAGRFFTV